MSMPVLQPRLFLGLRTGIRKGVQFLSELEILYPAGGVLVAHNYSQKRQRYLYLGDKLRELTCLAVSPNKKLIAVADKGEKPIITIYESTSLKRRKILLPPSDSQAQAFQHICFSHDNRYLMAVLGDPDWMFVSYMWDKGKVDSSYKAFNPQNPGPVLELYPNPFDSTNVCAVGPGLFRLLQLTENQWRPYGFTKSDLYPLTCTCWLGTDRVLAGTEDGRLLFVESGELKAVYRATEVQFIDFKSTELAAPGEEEQIFTSDDGVHNRIQEIIAFSRGFAFVMGVSNVVLFERETHNKYLKRNVFRIEFMADEKIADDSSSVEFTLNAIQTLTISPNGNSLLVTTGRSQLYTVPLWGPDLHERPEIFFTPLGDRLHQGAIAVLAVCSWKTIFMTCGKIDHTVRVWNYTTDVLELTKWYQENITSASLHPTGLFAIAGFTDKLRYMELLIDDILTMREFPMKECLLCSFSTNGHLFAAVESNIIHVYSSITHEIMFNLKGHTGRINGLSWNNKDTKLISCGSDGAIYEWSTHLGKKTGEIFDKTCQFLSVDITSDGKTVYVVGSDGCIREITDSQLVRQTFIEKWLNCVMLSRSDLMLFVTGGEGSVISVKFPLSPVPGFHEYHVHNQPITSMCISYDDQLLLTSSQDGSICVWKITATEGKTVKLDKDFTFSTNILIAKDELAEKISTIHDLKINMEELMTEHSYKMSAIEAEQSDNITEIHEAYNQAIAELQEKIEQTGKNHTEEINTINTDIASIKEEHQKTVETLEAGFKAKLVVEYDKYADLDERTHQMRQGFMRQIDDLANSKKTSVEDLTTTYESRLKEKLSEIDDLHHAATNLDKDDEEINKQIEDDAEREIMEIKTVYEGKLREERETIAKLRVEGGNMRKKYIGCQKEIEFYKHQIAKLHGQHQKILKVIGSHERAISDLKREMQERDATIPEKESRIYELKRKNQELEKYRFVLNYKIKELQNQIRPKEKEIEEKKQQLGEMEEELEGLQKINTSLELQTQELKEKLKATNNELDKERNENKKNNATLNRMRLDVHNAYGIIQDLKKLKSAVKELYHKYSMDPAYVSTRKVDEDIQDEFMRQREFLEHTIKVLKKQVSLQSSGRTSEGKVMEEHAELIEEINRLRRDLKITQHHIRDMESILGPGARYMNPKHAQDKLEAAIKAREAIKQEYEGKMEKLEITNTQLKDEVDKLRAEVQDKQITEPEEKPKSREKQRFFMNM